VSRTVHHCIVCDYEVRNNEIDYPEVCPQCGEILDHEDEEYE